MSQWIIKQPLNVSVQKVSISPHYCLHALSYHLFTNALSIQRANHKKMSSVIFFYLAVSWYCLKWKFPPLCKIGFTFHFPRWIIVRKGYNLLCHYVSTMFCAILTITQFVIYYVVVMPSIRTCTKVAIIILLRAVRSHFSLMFFFSLETDYIP